MKQLRSLLFFFLFSFFFFNYNWEALLYGVSALLPPKGLIRDMAASRAQAGKVSDKCQYSVVPYSKAVLKNDGDVTKEHKTSSKWSQWPNLGHSKIEGRTVID